MQQCSTTSFRRVKSHRNFAATLTKRPAYIHKPVLGLLITRHRVYESVGIFHLGGKGSTHLPCPPVLTHEQNSLL